MRTGRAYSSKSGKGETSVMSAAVKGPDTPGTSRASPMLTPSIRAWGSGLR